MKYIRYCTSIALNYYVVLVNNAQTYRYDVPIQITLSCGLQQKINPIRSRLSLLRQDTQALLNDLLTHNAIMVSRSCTAGKIYRKEVTVVVEQSIIFESLGLFFVFRFRFGFGFYLSNFNKYFNKYFNKICEDT